MRVYLPSVCPSKSSLAFMILISSLFLLPWTGEVSGGGISNIAAVDIFANHASSIYYDDIYLPPRQTCSTCLYL